MKSSELPTYDERGWYIKRVPVVVFGDVDRCFVDTDKVFDLAVDATAHNTSLTADQLHEEYQRTIAARTSFNFVGFINHQLRHTKYSWQRDVEADFIERGLKQDLLMKDARKIIDYVTEEALPFALFTYGASSPNRAGHEWADSERGQLAKMSASKLGSWPYYVSNQHQKGATATSWWKKDGFWLPPTMSAEPETQIVAKWAILLDDKNPSFVGKNGRLLCIRVTPEEEANRRDYQQGELLDGVVAVHGMTEALGALKTAIAYGRHRS